MRNSTNAQVRQRSIQSFAFVIAVTICILFSICFAVSTLLQSRQSGRIQLDSRINPNTALMPSLARLPGIGIVRAGAITAYRRNFAEQHSGKPAFQNCDDLQKVRGIGPKTVQNISKWLKFE